MNGILAWGKRGLSPISMVEHKVSGHDQAIAGLIDAIRQLMMPAAGNSRPIGFTADIEGDGK